MRTEPTNIKVVVRVRPYNQRELARNQRSIIKVMDKTTLLFDPDEIDEEFFFHGSKQTFRDITKRVHKKLSMEFDRVFDIDATNQQIFEECSSPVVDSVLNGYNCSVFVYGATGAGKTFTMLGSEDCVGLTYLTMRHLFDKIESQSEIRKFNVAVSYLEVYNELVMNLLTKTGPLKLREDNTGAVVSGITPKPIFNAEELLHLLKIGNENRTQHPTDANAESSRSHAVFQVHILMTERDTNIKREIKLSMIDLAGSERAAGTKGIGLRFREGAFINKSLLALGNCINKLADGLKHIPYRDSNLTRILKDSLGGNCQTLMVANVSMSSLTYEDTYNTLKYASRAKKIRNTLRQIAFKTNIPNDFYIEKLDEITTENNRLKELQKTLEAKIADLENTAAQIPASNTFDKIEVQNWYCKIDAVYEKVMKTQELLIELQNKGNNYCFKLKEHAERYREIFTSNKLSLKEDIENLTNTMNCNKKQIEEHTEEKKLLYNKLQDAYQDLKKLKEQIKTTNSFDILYIYQEYKDLKILSNKESIKTNQASDINNEVIAEIKKLQQTLALSYEILQKYYEEYNIKFDMKHYLDELLHILHLNVSLMNENDEKETVEATTENNNLLNDGPRLCSDINEESAVVTDSNSSNVKELTVSHLDFENNIDLALSVDSDFAYHQKRLRNQSNFIIPTIQNECMSI